MKQHVFLTAILVRDYDEAIGFYVDKLGFDVRLDNPLSPERRWVVLAPAGGSQGCILLAKAENQRQRDRIGNQAGGRVFLFLDTDDFDRDYRLYTGRGCALRRGTAHRRLWHGGGVRGSIRQPLGSDPARRSSRHR